MRTRPTVLYFSPAERPVPDLIASWLGTKPFAVMHFCDRATLETVTRRSPPTLIVVDADGDAMSFNLLEGPQGMRFDRAIGRAAWRPASAGTYEVRIAVSDGTVASEQTYRLHVVGSTERMAFASEPPLSVRLGRLYRYQPLLLNTPSTAPRFSLLAAPPRMQIDPDTGLISWMPTSGDPTSSAVTLVASSGVQQVRQRFQIALTEGNTAPQIT